MADKQQAFRDAVNAHTNLNTFGAIVALVEGGCFYGPSGGYEKDATRIIKIAKAAIQKQLTLYDKAMQRTQDGGAS